MNVIARLEYELAYYDSAVHRFNHYTTRTPKQWCRWTESARGSSQLNSRSGKVASCLPFFTSFPRNPCYVGLAMRTQIRPWSDFPLLVVSEEESPLSPVIAQFCLLLFGHRGCEEGGCKVWAGGRSQSQTWE